MPRHVGGITPSWALHVNCPAVIRLPHIAVLSSFWRETSLVNILGPRSILPSLITSAIYFPLFAYYCSKTYHYYHLRLILCKRQGRRDWQPLCTRWEQSYLYLCAGPRWLLISGAVSSWHLLVETGSLREIDPWYLCQGKTSATLHLKPSTWGNQRGARSHQAKFSGAVAGDSTLQDRGVARYLLPLLLVLLVYLSVFALVPFYRKSQK